MSIQPTLLVVEEEVKQSIKAIFYHFNSKEELYQAVLERAATGVLQLSQMETEHLSPERALKQDALGKRDRISHEGRLPVAMCHHQLPQLLSQLGILPPLSQDRVLLG